MYDLVKEPRGHTYRALLAFAREKCPYFLLVERPEILLDSEGRAVLQALAPYLVEEIETWEWPGTRLHTKEPATVRTFDFTPDSMRVLVDSTEGLYDWHGSARLEDLCLLRADRSPWLVTIAHESCAYFDVSEKDKSELIAAVPELGPILEEYEWPEA